jgi:GPI ethanolamine phosphate transferase 3 subunit O
VLVSRSAVTAGTSLKPRVAQHITTSLFSSLCVFICLCVILQMFRRRLASWPVLALIALYAASVLLFCSSMLSTSTVMHTVATEVCADTVATPVDQVVLILIDAMRPDFVLSKLRPFARTGGQCDVHGDHSLQTILAENRYTGPTLHYMEDSLRSDSDASLGYFLVADAPTTTAQRIKAIATGTMPAFLEAGSNFNSEAIEVDSIVGQMNGSAVLLGDDTWEKLFPNTPARRHWKHAVGIPSFDVADFHTNDDAVLSEIYEVLRRETPEAVMAAAPPARTSADAHARLVVAHFLGVDHVGHRIDSDNPFMKGKILQLDEMLRNVSHLLRERPTTMNTMLLVMGDHGMTNSGDHGGGSAQETDTFLFAQYFPGPLRPTTDTLVSDDNVTNATTASSPAANTRRARRLMQQRWHSRVDAEFDRLQSCRTAAGVLQDKLGATYQVDVTATVAVLLGRPIPYSSFGRVIPEVLALANATADVEAAERCNLQQLERYFRESAMRIPRNASWLPPHNLSLTHKLADMSYYARRTRTDMRPSGMFIGSTGLLLCAMSLLWSPGIRAYLSPRGSGWVMRWTVLVLVLRLCSVFSNSFVVNEDSELLGLLNSLLLLLWVPRLLTAAKVVWRSQDDLALGPSKAANCHVPARQWLQRLAALQRTNIVFNGLLLLGLRVAVPALLRYRAHITHTVETESAVDRFVSGHPALHVERVGIVATGILWAVLYPRVVPLPVVVATVMAIAGVYHVPVAHHAVPLLCTVAAPHLWRCVVPLKPLRCCWWAPYRYFVLILWLSSLCNGKVATAVVVAVYGTVLPRLCCVLWAAPLLTQTTVLHLFAYVGFFAEGHQCMLNTIDWNASFVGMPFYNMYLGGVLVLSRTFHAFLLVPLALCIAPLVVGDAVRDFTQEDVAVAAAKKSDNTIEALQAENETQSSTSLAGNGGRGDGRGVVVVIAVYLHLLVVQSAVSCFNGYIQKTHLMLYPIFCPKLLFDAVAALLTSAVVLMTMAFLLPAEKQNRWVEVPDHR